MRGGDGRRSRAGLLQEALRIQRSHATAGGRSHGLAVHAVLHVAGMEHAGNVGARAALGDDVTFRVGSIWPLKTLVLGM